MKRIEQKREDCWAIEDLFQTDELWDDQYRELEKEVLEVPKYSGKLSDAEMLFEYLKNFEKISLLGERLYVYANQRLHEDTTNSKYQEMSDRATTIMMKLEQATAFVGPELIKNSETISQLLAKEKKLAPYQHYLGEYLRKKEHILSDSLEKMLAGTGEMTDTPSDIFSMFNNADVKFDSAIDSNGVEHEVTHGTFIPLLKDEDRELRKSAFDSMYQQYDKYKNTLAAIYRGNCKQYAFVADARNYKDALSYGLSGSYIPVEVYTQLIETVHDYLPLMHRYVDIRKRLLQLKELHMYDLYVPMVDGIKWNVSFEDAKKIVLQGLAPLGEEYLSRLEDGFEQRWIDIYENEGKRSGAYSWGAYGTHPYVLLNYQGGIDDVFTLAHEMGHALHSSYSDANQSYLDAGYRIFVAEVASTCNEALLIHYLLNKAEDKREKAYLLNYFLEQFKGTMFRQTMFAEFEKIAHEMTAKGQALTPDSLGKAYYELNKMYFGHNMVIDEQIQYEWSRIPHFYTPFYVYQYATGFAAAIYISRKILAGDSEVLEGYHKFLKSGGSLDPIDLLKLAGVDMTKKGPIVEAMELFHELLDQIELLG